VHVGMSRGHGRRAVATVVAALAALGAVACDPVPPINPFGSLDAVAGAGGTVTVQGWAIDSDTTDPIAVHVYVDGALAVGRPAASPRPDVGAAYPASGADHGFDLQIGGLAAGRHTVCVYAINAGPGENVLLDCRNTDLPTGAPFGRTDGRSIEPGPDPTDPTTKTFAFWGWAIDPDTTDPVEIRARVISRRPVLTDVTTIVVAGEPRPDVAAAFPGYGERHGFTVRVIIRQDDFICLWVTNVGPPADDPSLMCDVPLDGV
jgi:hypothetical protein